MKVVVTIESARETSTGKLLSISFENMECLAITTIFRTPRSIHSFLFMAASKAKRPMQQMEHKLSSGQIPSRFHMAVTPPRAVVTTLRASASMAITLRGGEVAFPMIAEFHVLMATFSHRSF
eukprot:TRINITY_DN49016_c0_g1_i1.p1 TRINITY_DN49016_c0_g1~~TRINITY_DN49016_c0_g1_i1.p1  ORF type:complete len:122 (+),score=4.45 TRINITY_DN49016_c0_g1_i1:138-503(+)